MSTTESVFVVRCKLKPFEDRETALNLLTPLFPDIDDTDEDRFYCWMNLREVVKSHHPPLRFINEGLDNIWVDWVIATAYDDLLSPIYAPGYNLEKGIPMAELHRIDAEFTELFGEHREPGVYVVSYPWYNGCEEPEPQMPDFTPEALKFVTKEITPKGEQLTGTFPAETPELTLVDVTPEERWYHVAYACPLKSGNIMSELIYHAPDGVANIMAIKDTVVERLSTAGIRSVKPEQVALLSVHRVTESGDFIDD